MRKVNNNSLSNEDQKFEIQLNCCKLEFDEQLRFGAYIDCLCGKLSKRIGIFNRIKAYLPRPERILHYNSLINPLILYYSVSWTSCCSHDNVN